MFSGDEHTSIWNTPAGTARRREPRGCHKGQKNADVETVHESVRHFLDPVDVALTTQTPSSRGGFNRSVTCMPAEISLGPYRTFIGHWTRSSNLLPMTICGTVLLGPVECFHVVSELWYSSPILSFPCLPKSHISDKSRCLTARARIQRTVHIIHNY